MWKGIPREFTEADGSWRKLKFSYTSPKTEILTKYRRKKFGTRPPLPNNMLSKLRNTCETAARGSSRNLAESDGS